MTPHEIAAIAKANSIIRTAKALIKAIENKDKLTIEGSRDSLITRVEELQEYVRA